LSALFNILNSAGLNDVDFLDLFAGTGRVALEALGRGARSATCVEADRTLARAISSHFGDAGYAGRARCVCSDVRRAIPSLAKEVEAGCPAYGVIFADPPYDSGWGGVLPLLIAENRRLMAQGGVFIFERSSRETPVDIFVPRDDRIYGETVMSFYWNREANIA
jgi:16S rRNA (guanine(966)-N(2))-methyltransferase RsmD